MALVWVCDVCGWVWLQGEKIPSHCASNKCHSRRWNHKAGSDVAILAAKPESEVATTPAPEVVKLAAEPTARTSQRPAHDPETCRVYHCGLCVASGKKA